MLTDGPQICARTTHRSTSQSITTTKLGRTGTKGNYLASTRLMGTVASKGKFNGKKTNHSARKTKIQTLCGAGVADSAVMQLSGHKSVQSLNHYKRPSLEGESHVSFAEQLPSTTIYFSRAASFSSAFSVTTSVVDPVQQPPATLPRPVISQIQPPSVIASAVQSPPVFGQVQLRPQSVTQASVHSPLQLVTKEQMNVAVSSSNQGLFTNGSFSNCTFNLNFGQKPKRPRVIYSDSEEDCMTTLHLRTIYGQSSYA